jgi:SagB-type dehydrogenase family enzyme
MSKLRAVLSRLTLDRVSLTFFLEGIAGYAPDPGAMEPRSYPGYPGHDLPTVRPRLWPSLDRVLASRRSIREVRPDLPASRLLSRVLRFSHGVSADHGRGPVPSSGGLQALELYLAILVDGWVPAGCFHYDRRGHRLSRIALHATEARWRELVPALTDLPRVPVLFVLVGDGARVEKKYGERGAQFLFLEAGHLMQNLCLTCASVGLSTIPLGGYLEDGVAREFCLPPTDLVLYVGGCGLVAP